MIHSEFNKETGILETRFEGEVCIKEMLDYIISIREKKYLPQVLKIYSDATKGRFAEKVATKDLEMFLEENQITLSQKKLLYDAFVVSSAFETAIGMLYRELNKIENYKFEIFSSQEAAIEWLQKF